MTHRLQQLDTHTGFFLLRNAFSLPRLLFLLRLSPCNQHSDDLEAHDECTSNSAVSICNVHINDTGWKQAKLPVRFGGLGYRSVGDLALPAYFFSRESNRHFVSTIDPPPSDPSVESASDAITTWKSSDLRSSDDLVRQSIWDAPFSSTQVTAMKTILSQHIFKETPKFFSITYTILNFRQPKS